MKRIAQIISLGLHPILMPFCAMCVLVYMGPYSFLFTAKGKFLILLIVFMFTLVLPILFILIIRWFGFISSLHLEKQKDRIAPLLFAILSCYFNGLLFHKITTLPPIFSQIMIGLSFLLLILVGITRFWKISLHMAAVGGFLSLIYWSNYANVLFPIMILLSGILGTVRLYLRRHTPAQVYLGFLVGASFMSSFFYFFY